MYERLEGLIGKENIEKLNSKTVAVVGLGGVGGYVVETLIRNGINDIILIDFDNVDINNKNRQIIALDNTLNKPKTDVFKERILAIDKDCNITILNMFLSSILLISFIFLFIFIDHPSSLASELIDLIFIITS